MTKTVELLFDLGSPYSYLASTQIEALAARQGAALVLTPIVLGGIFKALGSPQLPAAPRLAHNKGDVERWARRYGVPFAWAPSFPARTISAHRVLVAAQGDARSKAMAALFRAYWAEQKDISDAAVIKAALDGAGLPGAELLARAEEQPVKDALRANTDKALERGVFGVPTIFVGEELFFGNDRLDFVEEALAQAR